VGFSAVNRTGCWQRLEDIEQEQKDSEVQLFDRARPSGSNIADVNVAHAQTAGAWPKSKLRVPIKDLTGPGATVG
jgi:hypothetical protein